MNITPAQLAEYVDLARAGDLKARERVVEALWEPLSCMAQRVHVKHLRKVDADDLLNVAAASILRSLETFDPARGVRFSTYCMGRARGAMSDHVREIDYLPRSARSRTRRLDHHADQFKVKHGRPPTVEELQDATGLCDREFGKHARAETATLVSLYDVTAENENRPDTIIDGLAARPIDSGMAKAEADDIVKFVLHRYGLKSALLLRLKFIHG